MKNLTKSMKQSPLWEATSRSASQEIPAFYRTQRLITVLTAAYHWQKGSKECKYILFLTLKNLIEESKTFYTDITTDNTTAVLHHCIYTEMRLTALRNRHVVKSIALFPSSLSTSV
jgi:hypothetical protein